MSELLKKLKSFIESEKHINSLCIKDASCNRPYYRVYCGGFYKGREDVLNNIMKTIENLEKETRV